MNVFLKAVKPANAPKALGPYSPAVKLGDFVYLSEPYPARSCVQVARLPKDVKVEIECIVIDTLVYEQQMAAQESGCSGCGGGCDGGCC